MLNTQRYANPIIPGYYPDPSIVKVGEEDFYLVTSSFEYFPAVPIFHSKDLIHWKQIGHVLTRESQVNLLERKSSEGIYAATIRCHRGIFYMITTDVMGIGNFFVTAEDPAGPWSDPIRIPHANIDPSLMFDDDGKVYVTAQKGWDRESHIIQYEIDIQTGQALSEPVVVCRGDGGVWTEGAHLYKINGMYYVLAACGGTGPQHRCIIARSTEPLGEYELYDRAILTHKDLPLHPIQCTGHADFVEDRNGNWWAVFLGVRPIGSEKFSVLGRETFLAPVTWDADGWPMIDNNAGTVNLVMEAPNLSGAGDWQGWGEYADHFDKGELDHSWAFVRTHDKAMYSLTEKPGSLRLSGKANHLSDAGTPAFVARRQQHVHMSFESLMSFQPVVDEEEAGLAVRYNEQAHYEIGVKRISGNPYVVAHATVKGETKELGRAAFDGDEILLRIASDEWCYDLQYAVGAGEFVTLGQADAYYLSPECNGGFTGVCIGVYATGNGKISETPAYFDWVKYSGF
jgi:xylan 1,4-beta-xylosidase